MTDENKKKASQRKTVHWHACTTCDDSYEDNCTSTKTDGQCPVCRGGRGFAELIEGRKPRPCCRSKARLATKEERKNYRLSGDRLWFMCAACKRHFSHRPAPTDTETEGTP